VEEYNIKECIQTRQSATQVPSKNKSLLQLSCIVSFTMQLLIKRYAFNKEHERDSEMFTNSGFIESIKDFQCGFLLLYFICSGLASFYPQNENIPECSFTSSVKARLII